MNYKELRKQLKEGVASLYLFYGEEVFLRDYMAEQIRKKVVDPEYADFNELILDAETLSPSAVEDFFEAYPFMAEKKFLKIHNTGLYSARKPGTPGIPEADKEAYIRLFSAIPDYVTVLVTGDAPDKRGALYKATDKNGVVCEFSYLEKAELKEHISRKLAAAGKDMSAADAEHLLELCGPDLTNLQLQLEKLIAYTGGRQKICREDMDVNIAPPLLNKVYDLSEAMLSGDKVYALKLLSDFQHTPGESAVHILAILGGAFSDLYRASAIAKESMSYADMKAAMHLPANRGFIADKLFRRVKTADPGFIREQLSACVRAENDIKNGVSAEWQTLELLILKAFLKKN